MAAKPKTNKDGLRIVTLKADVTYAIGDFINTPEVFMSETGKQRFRNGIAEFKHLNGLPQDVGARYKIVRVPTANTVGISLRLGDDGVINEEVTLKQLREGWFGQEHHPWLFCDSWAAYESGQEPDFLNSYARKHPTPERKVGTKVTTLEDRMKDIK